MKPYDATRYLRQMKYLPDVTPWCSVLVALLWLFMTPLNYNAIYYSSPFVELKEAKYAHPEPDPATILTISIRKKGDVFIFGKKVDELPRLGELILEKKEELQIPGRKVLLAVDGSAPWGRVTEVLRTVKTAGVEVVGLLTERGNNNVLDYFGMKKLYRVKGLKWPESAG